MYFDVVQPVQFKKPESLLKDVPIHLFKNMNSESQPGRIQA